MSSWTSSILYSLFYSDTGKLFSLLKFFFFDVMLTAICTYVGPTRMFSIRPGIKLTVLLKTADKTSDDIRLCRLVQPLVSPNGTNTHMPERILPSSHTQFLSPSYQFLYDSVNSIRINRLPFNPLIKLLSKS